MGFFSFKTRLLIFVCALLFILFLGPFVQVDSKSRKLAIHSLTSSTHVIPEVEETLISPINQHSTSSHHFTFGYIHGFSASRIEISPIVEDVANYYAAPIYFARLTGHGIDDKGESFAQSKCLDWLNDADRVVEKAKLKDHELVLIGTSFGGLLSSFAAIEHPDDIKALILISPFFELTNPMSRFVSGPFGKYLAKIIIGSTYEFTPKNELNRKFWTTRYSTEVIPQMMDCVNLMRQQDFSKIKVPLLIFYTEKDEVVSVQAIKERFKYFGSTKKYLVEVPQATNHVLTGKIMDPQTVDFVEARIKEFLDEI